MAILYLNLKGEYFDQIKAGTKRFEYRLCSGHWKRRLLSKGKINSFDGIVIRRGYPKADDHSRHIIRPWRGARIETIDHIEFGKKPVRVFAIRVN